MGRIATAATTGVVLSAAAILLATLLPSSGNPAPSTHAFGWTRTPGLADFLRNVLLFVPLGAALTLTRLSPGRALLAGLSFSCLVELLQLAVPGRFAGLPDLAANALGSALGIFLVRTHRGWLFPPAAERRVLCALSGALAALMVLAPAVFFAPVSTGLRVFGHRSPLPFKSLFPYGGTVVSASVDELELPQGPIADSDGVWERLLGDHSLVVEVIASEPPAGQAGFLAVADMQHTTVIFLGPDRHDLEYQFLTRGKLLGLEPGAVRLAGALSQVRPGEALRIRVEHVGPDICVEIDAELRCGGFGVGDGWRLVAPRFLARSRISGFVSVCWLAMLCFPLGYWSLGRGTGIALAGACTLALIFAPGWLGLLPAPGGQLLAPITGIAMGRMARRGLAAWAQAREGGGAPGVYSP